MTDDTSHLERATGPAGGPEAFEAEVERMLLEVQRQVERDWRHAKRRPQTDRRPRR